MFFLSQIPAMVAPQHDNEIPLGSATLGSVEQPSNWRVDEGDRGQVRLHRTFPFVMHDDVLMLTRLGHGDARRRHIGEIILDDVREFHGFEWMQVKTSAWGHNTVSAA